MASCLELTVGSLHLSHWIGSERVSAQLYSCRQLSREQDPLVYTQSTDRFLPDCCWTHTLKSRNRSSLQLLKLHELHVKVELIDPTKVLQLGALGKHEQHEDLPVKTSLIILLDCKTSRRVVIGLCTDSSLLPLEVGVLFSGGDFPLMGVLLLLLLLAGDTDNLFLSS